MCADGDLRSLTFSVLETGAKLELLGQNYRQNSARRLIGAVNKNVIYSEQPLFWLTQHKYFPLFGRYFVGVGF